MLQITEPIPIEYLEEYQLLSAKLDTSLPDKALDKNLLIATWNLRSFGDLFDNWVAGANDTPKRDKQSLLCIAEIVSRFDVIAIQEVKGNLLSRHHRSVFSHPWPAWDTFHHHRGHENHL
jgi:hypothetical protein